VRICSLLPSATEIVFALEQQDSLVGVTHECDYPPEACRIPKVTRTNIAVGLASREIDAAVRSTLDTTGSLYELDLPLIERLAPDLVLTQRLCDVCAVSFDRVEQSVADLPSRPRVLNLEPHSLEDILASIRAVAEAIGCEAGAVVGGLRARIDSVAAKTSGVAHRPRVLCMEWVDPPYCGGHWMKELVEIAGGRDELANHHRPSSRIEWRRVLDFAPEVIVLTCCGFDLARCRQEAEILARFEGAADLPAAKAGRVYATDGSAYFSRPGPRIVDSLEILTHLLQPELFPPPRLEAAFCPVTLR
jgi:iron complex transport system substrate-binding protein